jgi:hypothetical protein
VLWPPNHAFHTISIEGVVDPDGGDVDITITGVTSDEPVDAEGDGTTCPDAVIRGDGTVDLRAERSGKGNGRVYTIEFTATDDTGESCNGTVFVCVPHDQRKKNGGCIRDEVQYDVTDCGTTRRTVAEPLTSSVLARVANGQITILFETVNAVPVEVEIFDLRGRLVRHLAAQDFQAGAHEVRWDGRDAQGREAASGIYLVRVVVGGEPRTAKTVWMR